MVRAAAFLTTSLALTVTGACGWAAILLGGGMFAASYLITVPRAPRVLMRKH